ALSGVHAVLTAAAMPATMRKRMPVLVPIPYAKHPLTQYALAIDEVCYVGEPIAIVVAESRYLAEDAAARVEVNYEPLAAVSDCRSAIESGAPRAHLDTPDNSAAVFKVGYGDVAGAFANAAHVFKEDIWHHRGCGHSLEGRAVLAAPDAAARSSSPARGGGA